MKVLLNTIALCFTSIVCFSQASTLLPSQAIPRDTTVSNFLYVNTTNNRIFAVKQDSLKLKMFQMKWMKDTLNNRVSPLMRISVANDSMSVMRTRINARLMKTDTTAHWRSINWVPSWSQVTNKPSFASVASSGLYSDLSGKPTIPTNTIDLVNGSGFISSESDPLFDTKLASKSTSNLSEGSNQYFTNSRARSSISLTTLGSNGASTYNSSTGVLNIPNYTNTYTAGTGIGISSNVITNSAPDQIVSLTAGNGIQITGSYPTFTISQIAPTITTPTRVIGTPFTISTTKPATVFYTVLCTSTNPLLIGSSSATLYLEYSLNGGTSYIPVTSTGNSNSVALSVTIAITNGQTGILSGVVPANSLVRIRSVIAGSATVSYVSGQEIVY